MIGRRVLFSLRSSLFRQAGAVAQIRNLSAGAAPVSNAASSSAVPDLSSSSASFLDDELGAYTKPDMKVKAVNLSAVKTNGSTKRFYHQVSVEPYGDPNTVGGGWAVKLGSYFLRTRQQKLFVLPTKALAEAIALEWDSQVIRIKPTSMPLMSLATTALDQVPYEKEKMLDSITRNLHMDMTCCRVTYPSTVVKLQEKHWDPLLEWMKETHGCEFDTISNIGELRQSEAVADKLMNMIANQNDWVFSALSSAITTTKSVIIGLALLQHRLTVSQAYEAARVEHDYQIKTYGHVYGIYGHSIDIEYMKHQLATTRTFLNLLGVHGLCHHSGSPFYPSLDASSASHLPITPAVIRSIDYLTPEQANAAAEKKAIKMARIEEAERREHELDPFKVDEGLLLELLRQHRAQLAKDKSAHDAKTTKDAEVLAK